MDDRKPERESKGVRAFMWERLVRNNKLWVEPCENEDLDNGMILYHGSYTAVPEIDLTKCFPGHDLGAGFYVTSSLEMACRYAKAAVRKAVLCGTVPENFTEKDGKISAYRFQWKSMTSGCCMIVTSREWLRCIAGNRNRELAWDEWESDYKMCDVLWTKIVDDETSLYQQAYLSGAYGESGTKEAEDMAMRIIRRKREALWHGLKDQYCFRTPDGVAELTYIGTKSCGEIMQC